jgi:hypothetical protein
MEKVDQDGHVIGFSILNVIESQAEAPVPITLRDAAAQRRQLQRLCVTPALTPPTEGDTDLPTTGPDSAQCSAGTPAIHSRYGELGHNTGIATPSVPAFLDAG